MFFTCFILVWISWAFPVKSQVFLKSINYYEPVPANGALSPTVMKPFNPYSRPLIISNKRIPLQNPWMESAGIPLQMKPPPRQKVPLYYPLAKFNNNLYTGRLRNSKINNLESNRNNNMNSDNHNYNNYNSLPKEVNYKLNVPDENVKSQEGKLEIDSGEIDKNRINDQIRKQEQMRNFYLGKNNGLVTEPKKYMEPPGFASSDYRLYTKAKENLENGRKKNVEHKKENYYKNHRMNGEKDSIENHNYRAPYIRDHAPENESEELEESSENEEENEEGKDTKKFNNASEISPDGDRVQFQIQGHNGPKTYVFGYDTGDGDNRQYRLEERLKDGTVKGQYGYYDARGKLRSIKYIARPMEGYEEIHHESFLPDSSN